MYDFVDNSFSLTSEKLKLPRDIVESRYNKHIYGTAYHAAYQ